MKNLDNSMIKITWKFFGIIFLILKFNSLFDKKTIKKNYILRNILNIFKKKSIFVRNVSEILQKQLFS